MATHLWTIEQADGRLRFTAKPRAVLEPDTHRFFAEQVFPDPARTDDFLLDHWPALRITYEWRGRPECEIRGTPGGRAEGFVGESPASAPVHHRPAAPERLRTRLKQRVRRALHAALSAHRRIDWTDILACPACHADVRLTATEVRCTACHRRYPITDGVPIMLEAARSEADRPARDADWTSWPSGGAPRR